MVKFNLLIFLLLLVASSCRKKQERDYNSAADAPPPPGHCENMVFDEDELGTDCGGEECADCELNEAPCSYTSNKIFIHNGVMGQTFSATSNEIIQSNGDWTFYAYTGGGTTKFLELTFNGKPNILTTYSGKEDALNLLENEVFVKYHDPTNVDRIGTGEVYLTNNDGVYNAISCDFSFHEDGQAAPSETQWFNVSFN